MVSRAPRKRPSLSIIGAGRLGSALALALTSAGYPLQALVARHRRSAEKASRQLDVPTLTLAVRDLDKLPASTVTIIATPDDVIELVGNKLADLKADAGDGRIVLHTSGALSSSVLSPLATKGFAVGSLHPLIAVSDRLNGVPKWKGAFWCLEGQPGAVATARRIVRDLEGQSFSVSAESKALYHAAALMVSGQVVALFEIAIEMLTKAGISQAKARRILLPLIESNSRNLRRFDPPHALTGTFARGDLATVQRHLKALSGSGLKDALALYRILGLRSVSLASQTKTDKHVLKQIRRLLEEKVGNKSST